jgi:hypothetical protein
MPYGEICRAAPFQATPPDIAAKNPRTLLLISPCGEGPACGIDRAMAGC